MHKEEEIMKKNSLFALLFLCLLLSAAAQPDFAFAAGGKTGIKGFTFVQISDTHWGFSDPKINPEYKSTLQKAIDEINGLTPRPEFVVFTGDLTHTTDSPEERRARMSEFREIVRRLKVKDIRFLPGEHDASLDSAEAYTKFFGKTHYTFDRNGIHFIALDNVSDKTASLGDAQLKWLAGLLKKFRKDSTIIILTHRPLFDLYPDWEWWTRDGAQALELLKPFEHVTVLYGHIHQVNDHRAGSIALHAATGAMYPLPAPGSVPKKAPIPWDPAQPYKGLGFRTVEVKAGSGELAITEHPIAAAPAAEVGARVIKITAKKFEYSPGEIKLAKGEPATLEFTSLDVHHGFNCPELKVRADIYPGQTSRISITPDKAGTFHFHCDVFCGSGHEDMEGKIIVE
jgi:plastocyanin